MRIECGGSCGRTLEDTAVDYKPGDPCLRLGCQGTWCEVKEEAPRIDIMAASAWSGAFQGVDRMPSTEMSYELQRLREENADGANALREENARRRGMLDAARMQRDEALAKALKECQRLRMELADEKMQHAVALRMATTATLELGWAKRELQRLDPRLYRARYGK